jgi:serine/threonine protein kinase/TolA-binding protein
MKTQDARWIRIRDLFELAVNLPPDERGAFLDRNCGDDPILRDELNSLLVSDVEHTKGARSRGPLTGAIGAAVESSTRTRREEILGSIIGPYRLTSILGHGGTGTVYLGERADRQYSAQVAVKVVEGAALNAEISRRFKAERQILASLNHANIARLIDAGESKDGYPYLVMEYVHGETIDKYCDRLKLGVEQRLELLLKVCSAVQYAHQNLVVHRDLKPGNILVTPDGTPKLLDFGIAKLLDTSEAAAAMALTRMNDRVLTPEYASPEQILGQTVTTSSDVYSLGVILYELLTGLRPYKVSGTSQLELERTICLLDPARASTVIRQALSSAASDPPPSRNIHLISEARQVTPMRLRARLNGDLDSILMRALRKEAVHRYSSVEQFANDLRRHLANEPVLARQGNWAYYAQRFTRRHALAVSAATVFIALLTAALIFMSFQNKRIAEQRDVANREKQTSEAVANFMVNVFAAADPFTVQDKQVTATDLLDKSAANIRNDLAQQPIVKARLLEAIGRSYTRQGRADRGVGLLAEALEMRRRVENPNSPAIAIALKNLGESQLFHHETEAARKSFDEARQILEASGKQATSDYADVMLSIGRVEYDRGDAVQARRRIEEALPLLRNAYGPQHAEVGSALISLGYVLQWQNEYGPMEGVARQAVQIYQSSLPELHPDRLQAESLLAESLFNQGRIEEAAPLVEKVFLDKQKVFGNKSSRVAEQLQLLMELRRRQGRLVEAEKLAREAVALKKERLGESNYNTAYSRTSLATILWQRGKASEAEGELHAALTVYRETLPAGSLLIASAEHYLAEVLLSQNRYNEAATQAKLTLEHLSNADATPWRIARTENTLGEALFKLHNIAEAQSYLERSYKLLSATQSADVEAARLARTRLETLYTATNDQEKLATLRAVPTPFSSVKRPLRE